MGKKKQRLAPDPASAAENGGPGETTFEEALAEVERALAELEGSELPLDQSLAVYESGMQQLCRCYQLLEAAQKKVELLTGVDAEGKPQTKPLGSAGTD